MAATGFQSAMARLITDPDYRDRVRKRGADAGLTPLEASRLQRIAADPGLDINRTLHKGFRFGKLRTLLPLTCRLLGPARLGREAALFWQRQPPAGFSFLPEALAFCTFLDERRTGRSAGVRRLRVRHLDEVVAYERAVLELERTPRGAEAARSIAFAHDAVALLSALSRQRRPRAIAPRACRLTGLRSARGEVEWQIEYLAAGDTCVAA